jgi:hypothetical protein
MAYADSVAAAEVVRNVDPSAPPNPLVIDGLTLSSLAPLPQRLLLAAQANAWQNGVWLFLGDGLPLERPAAPDQYAHNSVFDNATLIPVENGKTLAGVVFGIQPAKKVTVDAAGDAGAHVLTRVSLPPIQVRVATTEDISLATMPATIDQVWVDDGDVVLVKEQIDARENGVYILRRSGGMERSVEPLVPGRVVVVAEGQQWAHTRHELVNACPIKIWRGGPLSPDDTSLNFSPLSERYNAHDYGAIGVDDPNLDDYTDLDAMHLAMASMSGNATSSAGAVLDLPAPADGRAYALPDDLHVTRQITLRGSSLGGNGRTKLKFKAGKGIVIHTRRAARRKARASGLFSRTWTSTGAGRSQASTTAPRITPTPAPTTSGTCSYAGRITATTSCSRALERRAPFRRGWPATLQRVTLISLAERAAPGARAKVTTGAPHGLASGVFVHVTDPGPGLSDLHDGTYEVEVVDETSFFLSGSTAGPVGAAGGGGFSLVIPDGDSFNAYRGGGVHKAAALWTVQTSSGIVIRTRATVRNCFVQPFTNCGVMVYGSGATPATLGENAPRVRLEATWVNGCGLGVAVQGPDASVVARDLTVGGVGKDTTAWPAKNKTGHGIHDAGAPGSAWVTANDDTSTGKAIYVSKNAGVASTWVGYYTEETNTGAETKAEEVLEPSRIMRPSTVLSGVIPPGNASTALMLQGAAVRNLDWVSRPDTRGAVADGSIELSADPFVGGPAASTQGPSVHTLRHSDDGPVPFVTRYKLPSRDPRPVNPLGPPPPPPPPPRPNEGEWEHGYFKPQGGTPATLRVLRSFLGT